MSISVPNLKLASLDRKKENTHTTAKDYPNKRKKNKATFGDSLGQPSHPLIITFPPLCSPIRANTERKHSQPRNALARASLGITRKEEKSPTYI
jgi:hypothetical protein